MIEYRLATKDDNQQLIELTASTGMEGEIALRIDRNPDFFKLLDLRGETKVFIAEENQKIIGSLCVSLQYVYIGKELFPVHYIGDFKVAKSQREKGIGVTLTNEVANYLISIDADLVFLNVSKGNIKPFSFFTNRSVGTDFKSIGIFNIYQFIGKKNKGTPRNYIVEASGHSDEVIHFFGETYKNYQLGSQITKKKLEGTSIFIIRQNNVIVGAICLMDTMHLKQNIVTKLSMKMNILLKLTNSIGPLLGFSKMPLLNQPVNMIYIKYLAIKNNDKQVFKTLIAYAKNIAYEKSFSFVSIGLHEKDPIINNLSGMMKFTFNSVGMLSSLKNSTGLVSKIKAGIPFEDYSLV
jgi:ribosomal protein S18 acetylase RimI-like enzyme